MMSVGNVATIAGLKALPAPTTDVVQIVEGYAGAGDGGGGTFVWDTSGGAYSSGVSFTFLLNIHGDDIISRTAGSFLADGWTKGGEVTISGTINNNGTFRVTGVTATNLTVGGVSFTPETANATLINCGDKGTTFAPNGASAKGWWVRQFSDALNVKWFGAKGDGTNDDNDTTSIQAAINAASVQGLNGGVQPIVFLPAGQYLITSTLSVTSQGLTIIGSGNASAAGFSGTAPRTTIRTAFGEETTRTAAITLGAPIPDASWDSGNYVNTSQGVSVIGISFFGLDDTAILDNGWGSYQLGAYGIIDWGSGSLTIKDCDFQRLEGGILGVASDFDRVVKCSFQNCKVGAWFAQRSDQLIHEGGRYSKCDTAIKITGAKAHTYTTLSLDTCGSPAQAPIDIVTHAGSIRPSENITFVTPWLEYQNYGGKDFGDAGTIIPSYFNFDGNAVTNKGLAIVNPFCTQGGTPNAFVGNLVRVGNATGINILGDLRDHRGSNTANITATLTGDAVSSFTVVDGGHGFDMVPRISLIGGGGSGAKGTAVLSGDSINSVTVLAGGSGYNSAPIVFALMPMIYFFGSNAATAQIIGTADYLTVSTPLPGQFFAGDGMATPTVSIKTVDNLGINLDVINPPTDATAGRITVRQVGDVADKPLFETYEVQALDIDVRKRMNLNADVTNASWLYQMVDSAQGPANGDSKNWGVTGSNMLWNGGHLVVGSTHIWMDDFGVLRSKQSAPSVARDGYALGSPSSIASLSATNTPNVTGLTMAKTYGTNAIEFFGGGRVGQTLVIEATAGITIEHDAAKIKLDGSGDFAMAAGDTLSLAMFTDQIWTEIARAVV